MARPTARGLAPEWSGRIGPVRGPSAVADRRAFDRNPLDPHDRGHSFAGGISGPISPHRLTLTRGAIALAGPCGPG